VEWEIRHCHYPDRPVRCRRLVTSDKTHIEHNESVVALIADMRVDMDFCRSRPKAKAMPTREDRQRREASRNGSAEPVLYSQLVRVVCSH
jgi:hypothetical protein